MDGEKRKLGIPTLDGALMDGVPAGYTILISGHPGAGTELIAKQIAASGEEPTIYFTTDETADEVLDTLARFDWTKDIRIEDISSRYYDRISEGKIAVNRRRRGDAALNEILASTGETDDENFLTTTADRIMDHDGPVRAIVDNLNFYFDEHEPEEVLSVLRALRTYNRHQGGLLLLTLSKGAVDDQLAQRLEANVDMVVEMEMDRMSSSFEHRMVVKKVMNHPELAQLFVYGVTEEGITPEMVMRVT